MYYVNFPMLFHPIDIQQKFGFHYPVGIFIDNQGAEIIRRSIPSEDYLHFRDYSRKSDDYAAYMDFYNSRSDLSEDEIISTWDKEEDGELKDLAQGHCIQISKLRALREAMALQRAEEPSEAVEEAINRFAGQLRFDKWREYYKKLK